MCDFYALISPRLNAFCRAFETVDNFFRSVYYSVAGIKQHVRRAYRRRAGVRLLESFSKTISSQKVLFTLFVVSAAFVAFCRWKRKLKEEVESQTILKQVPPHEADQTPHYLDQIDSIVSQKVSQGRVVDVGSESVQKSIVAQLEYTASKRFGSGKGTAMAVTLEPGIMVLNNHTWQQIDRDKPVIISWSRRYRVNQRDGSTLDPMPAKILKTYSSQWNVMPISGTELVMASVLELHVPTNLSLLVDDSYDPKEVFYMWTRTELGGIKTASVKNTFMMTGDQFLGNNSFDDNSDSAIPVPRLTQVMGGQVDGCGRGTSGSPLVHVLPTASGNQNRLRLFGVHCWGSKNRIPSIGYSCPLSKSLYEEAKSALMAKAGKCSVVRHSLIVPPHPTLGCDDPSLCEPGVVNSGYGALGDIHPAAAVNFQFPEYRSIQNLEVDVSGYINPIGGFSYGDTGAFSTKFRMTEIADHVKDFAREAFGEDAVPNKVPPDVKNATYYDCTGERIKPNTQRVRFSHTFISDATSPNQKIDREVMDVAAASYLTLLEEGIKADPAVRESIAPYSIDIALNGSNLSRGMSSMNMSTSSGFNALGKKMKKRELFPVDPETGKHCLSQQQETYINLLDERIRRGEVLGTPFVVCYKDEPVKVSKIEKHEIRAFAIISWSTSLLLRKYGLWIQRVMQIAPHIFGTAVGLNCTSDQWEDLLGYLSNNEEFDYFLDADYKKFDKKAISRFITEYVRSIFMHLTDLSDSFDDEEKRALNALLYDVMNPWIIERMTLFQVLGMNSSGNNITININTVANNLLIRYAYLTHKYKPRISRTFSFFREMTLVEWACKFEKEARVVTLGDDVIIAFKNGDFTNHDLIKMLALIGIEVTAPDKNSKSLAYKRGYPRKGGQDLGGSAPVEMAQRVFRKLDGFKYLTAPLHWKSIFKSLTVVNNAAQLNPTDLWGARLKNVLTEAAFHGPEDHAKVWHFCRSIDFNIMRLDTDLVWERSTLGRGNPDFDPNVHFEQVRTKFNNLGEIETDLLAEDDSELFFSSRESSGLVQYESLVEPADYSTDYLPVPVLGFCLPNHGVFAYPIIAWIIWLMIWPTVKSVCTYIITAYYFLPTFVGFRIEDCPFPVVIHFLLGCFVGKLLYARPVYEDFYPYCNSTGSYLTIFTGRVGES